MTGKGRVRDQALFLRPNGDKNEAWSAPFIKLSEVQAVLDKLAAYEDAEEQGLLVILPCKVGDMVYYRRGRDIIGDTADRIIIDGIDNQVLVGAHRAFMFCDFGRNVFLTREEAKAALKGLKGEAEDV